MEMEHGQARFVQEPNAPLPAPAPPLSRPCLFTPSYSEANDGLVAGKEEAQYPQGQKPRGGLGLGKSP